MATLEELLKQATQPQEWFSDVLKQCEKEILKNAHMFIANKHLRVIYYEHVDYVYESPLAAYLSKELDAKVTVKYVLDQRDGNWYTIKIERN